MEQEIYKIHYNWFAPVDSGYSEEFTTAEVGNGGLLFIKEHIPAGEGDKWYYDLIYPEGVEIRIFNPNMVYRRQKDIS